MADIYNLGSVSLKSIIVGWVCLFVIRINGAIANKPLNLHPYQYALFDYQTKHSIRIDSFSHHIYSHQRCGNKRTVLRLQAL
jgi:hypothetical protein